MQTVFGSHKRKFLFQVGGNLSKGDAHAFAQDFIAAAGMTPARKGRIDTYPYRGGGGFGFTGMFPLMESYLVIDTYDNIDEVEILLSTCKPERINLTALTNLIQCRIGKVKSIGTL